jgi:hypothetical protein
MKRRAGNTLAELMLATSISLLLLAMVGIMVSAYARNARKVSKSGITLQSLVVGLDRLRLEAREGIAIESPADGTTGHQLLLRRVAPGAIALGYDPHELVPVEYSLRPDGGLWRKFVDLKGIVYLDPVAFDIANFTCMRKGRLLELELEPREGPPVVARVEVGP